VLLLAQLITRSLPNVAANDPRVSCVVAQIPHVSGHRNARLMFGVRQFGELRERLAKDRAHRRDGGTSRRRSSGSASTLLSHSYVRLLCDPESGDSARSAFRRDG
jgi:hypothetical protein